MRVRKEEDPERRMTGGISYIFLSASMCHMLFILVLELHK